MLCHIWARAISCTCNYACIPGNAYLLFTIHISSGYGPWITDEVYKLISISNKFIRMLNQNSGFDVSLSLSVSLWFLQFLQNYCSKLCKQDCGVDWVPLKLLLLIQSLVEELQIEWRKFANCDVAKVGRECWETKQMNCLSFLVTSSDCKKFVEPFLFIMVKTAKVGCQ